MTLLKESIRPASDSSSEARTKPTLSRLKTNSSCSTEAGRLKTWEAAWLVWRMYAKFLKPQRLENLKSVTPGVLPFRRS